MRERKFKKLGIASVIAAVMLAAAAPNAHGETLYLTVDSKPMRLYAAPVPYALTSPAENVYRFESRKNDFGWSGDAENSRRRSELASVGDKYGPGETLWTSFSFVVGPEHAPFDGGKKHNMIHQWQSVQDTRVMRRPVLWVKLADGKLYIITRSYDATVVRYSAARPADGVIHNMVISGRVGKPGHLKVWLDGMEIVDTDAPIGDYKANPLVYPQWGLYQNNVEDPTVIYHANMEWGTNDLSARVSTPLAVNTPPGGWI